VIEPLPTPFANIRKEGGKEKEKKKKEECRYYIILHMGKHASLQNQKEKKGGEKEGKGVSSFVSPIIQGKAFFEFTGKEKKRNGILTWIAKKKQIRFPPGTREKGKKEKKGEVE